MTTTTMSLLFSSDPKNGAQSLDTTGSRFMVHLPQAIKFLQCKKINLVLNTASIWYHCKRFSIREFTQSNFRDAMDYDVDFTRRLNRHLIYRMVSAKTV